MLKRINSPSFQPINPGYDSVFVPGRLSIGLVVPLETYATRAEPTMERHLERVRLADELGFSALWLRDVPFNVPTFGDAGQMFDPFVYLGMLAGHTKRIALGAASIVLPLRHPAHVAKAAATADQLSGGRLILGVASGDRAEEFPALNHSYMERGARFRDGYEYVRRMGDTSPSFANGYGDLNGGMDMLPKPYGDKLPLLITGGSQQDPEWIAQNGDGWMTYPRPLAQQARVIEDWRTRVTAVGGPAKPVMQPLYLDLNDDENASPEPIHLGMHVGLNPLHDYLEQLQTIGINHVALNLRFNKADIEITMKRLADSILPRFHQD